MFARSPNLISVHLAHRLCFQRKPTTAASHPFPRTYLPSSVPWQSTQGPPPQSKGVWSAKAWYFQCYQFILFALNLFALIWFYFVSFWGCTWLVPRVYFWLFARGSLGEPQVPRMKPGLAACKKCFNPCIVSSVPVFLILFSVRIRVKSRVRYNV